MNELKPWEVVRFPWGTAVRHVRGRWDCLFLSPTGQQIDVTHLDVRLHDTGIVFFGGGRPLNAIVATMIAFLIVMGGGLIIGIPYMLWINREEESE